MRVMEATDKIPLSSLLHKIWRYKHKIFGKDKNTVGTGSSVTASNVGKIE